MNPYEPPKTPSEPELDECVRSWRELTSSDPVWFTLLMYVAVGPVFHCIRRWPPDRWGAMHVMGVVLWACCETAAVMLLDASL